MLRYGVGTRRWVRTITVAAGLAGAVSGLVFGCASGSDPDFGSDDAATSGGPIGSGGSAGAGGSGGNGSLCAVDCSAINTPACLKSVCNDGSYQGVVGECVVVPDAGAMCDDGNFCTIQDTCNDTAQCI